MSTKILGIGASPRVGGNSDQLLLQVLAGARAAGAETTAIRPAEMKFSGCRECDLCKTTGDCVVQDEMQRLYSLLDQAQAIVLASPIFFYGLPSQTKAMIDRCQARWWWRRLLKPTPQLRKTFSAGPGYLLAVGGSKREDMFQGVELCVRAFFESLDRPFGGSLLFGQMEAATDATDRGHAKQEAFEFGRRMVLEFTRGLAESK